MSFFYASFLLLSCFFNYTQMLNGEQLVAPYFSIRSQARDAARDFAGWTDYINQPSPRNRLYGAFAIIPEYTHSFSPDRITVPLFGSNLSGTRKSQLTISGTQTNNRSAIDLLADYFYLPPDFQSTVEFKPVTDTFLVDFSWYLGLDPWSPGLYLWLDAPLVHTRWDLNITENVTDIGIMSYAPGYFSPTAIPRSNLLNSFIEYAQGNSIPNSGLVTFEELKFSQMSQKRLVRTRFAEFRLRFGKNFLAEENYHCGANIQVAAPAGLRPHGQFLFEPMIGNGHHWELGIEINGHGTIWHNEAKMRWLLLYIDANLTHLFQSHQKRVFDLQQNGPLSRYMLATTMMSPTTNLLGGGTAPSLQFGNTILPVANFSALDVNVSVALQADVVAMLTFISEGMSIDFGYNYWGKSQEIIKVNRVDRFPANTYAIKGDAQIFGFIQNTSTAVALSATESKATINSGTNFPAVGTTNPLVIATAQKNPNIDFPQPATTAQSGTTPPQLLLFAPNDTVVTDQIQTSVNPVTLTTANLNIKNSGTTGSTHKIFTHYAYTWLEKDGWIPYLGIGADVEVSPNSTKIRQTAKPQTKIRTGISQWGLWLKGGVTFY